MTMTMTSTIAEDEKRLRELALYVASKCWRDEHFGVLKLNKILFYSDFLAYRRLGKAITGVEYRKYVHGPAPAIMRKVRRDLVQKGDAHEWQNPVPGRGGQPYNENRLLAIRTPEIDEHFSSSQISIVDEVIERLRADTGRDVSDLSHCHPGWKLAAMEEPIPYYTELLPLDGPSQLSATDLAKAKDIAIKFFQ
jgi:hypothetical protein|nr:Panacea domain-containing protein [Kofleriaceae bacterium]